MGSLDAAVAQLQPWIERWRADGSLRAARGLPSWPAGRSLLLSDDLAAELGSPAVGSWSLLVWNDDEGPGDEAGFAGPDLAEAGTGSVLGRVVLARGPFDDEAQACLDLRDALCDTLLRGVTSRSRPSSGEVWLRISRDAVGDGLRFDHLSRALLQRLHRVQGLRSASVLWITDPAIHGQLWELARDSGRLAGALLKRHTEDLMECPRCEFNDICDEAELG